MSSAGLVNNVNNVNRSNMMSIHSRNSSSNIKKNTNNNSPTTSTSTTTSSISTTVTTAALNILSSLSLSALSTTPSAAGRPSTPVPSLFAQQLQRQQLQDQQMHQQHRQAATGPQVAPTPAPAVATGAQQLKQQQPPHLFHLLNQFARSSPLSNTFTTSTPPTPNPTSLSTTADISVNPLHLDHHSVLTSAQSIGGKRQALVPATEGGLVRANSPNIVLPNNTPPSTSTSDNILSNQQQLPHHLNMRQVARSQQALEDEPSSPVVSTSVEQTLLLVRPTWVPDQSVTDCCICTRTFNSLRRKHHCRQCGRIMCHDCSSRNIAVPQLGYRKAVRVCNDCFEVAYLVAYIVSDDLGPSTQLYGARSLYDLIESSHRVLMQQQMDHQQALNDGNAIDGNEEVASIVGTNIQAVVDYGGLDALIYLCNIPHGYALHAVATNSLAALAELDQVRPVLILKGSIPVLFQLVTLYGGGANHARGGSAAGQFGQQNPFTTRSWSPTVASFSTAASAASGTSSSFPNSAGMMMSNAASVAVSAAAGMANKFSKAGTSWSPSNNSLGNYNGSSPMRSGGMEALQAQMVQRIESVTLVLMNITHIIHQMVPYPALSNFLVREGVFDTLMTLCLYFPARVMTRTMDRAIQQHKKDVQKLQSTQHYGSRVDGNNRRLSHIISPGTGASSPLMDALASNDESLVRMDDMFHTRLENMQGLAAKCLSIMASDINNQSFMVKDGTGRIDRLIQLLYSTQMDVVKYGCKTMAFLSLRNDKHKPDIVRGDSGSGASALLHVLTLGARSGQESLNRLTSPFVRSQEQQHPNQRRASSSVGSSTSDEEDDDSTHAAALGATHIHPEAVSHACCALANLATNTESQEILMSEPGLLKAVCDVVGLFPQQREIERHVARLLANLALYDQNKLCLLTAAPDQIQGQRQGEAQPQKQQHLPSQDTYEDNLEFSDDEFFVGLQPKSSVDKQKQHAQYDQGLQIPVLQSPRACRDIVPTLLKIGAMTVQITVVQNRPQQHQQGGRGLRSPGPNETTSAVFQTVPGMEDVQRHLIRAVDNLITSILQDSWNSEDEEEEGEVDIHHGQNDQFVYGDGMSAGSAKKSRAILTRTLWPTFEMVQSIQEATMDEDTERRATHLLATLTRQEELDRVYWEAMDRQQLAMERDRIVQLGRIEQEKEEQQRQLQQHRQQQQSKELQRQQKHEDLVSGPTKKGQKALPKLPIEAQEEKLAQKLNKKKQQQVEAQETLSIPQYSPTMPDPERFPLSVPMKKSQSKSSRADVAVQGEALLPPPPFPVSQLEPSLNGDEDDDLDENIDDGVEDGHPHPLNDIENHDVDQNQDLIEAYADQQFSEESKPVSRMKLDIEEEAEVDEEQVETEVGHAAENSTLAQTQEEEVENLDGADAGKILNATPVSVKESNTTSTLQNLAAVDSASIATGEEGPSGGGSASSSVVLGTLSSQGSLLQASSSSEDEDKKNAQDASTLANDETATLITSESAGAGGKDKNKKKKKKGKGAKF